MHTVYENSYPKMLFESLQDLIEFECLKSSINYGADPTIYTAALVHELILAHPPEIKEFRGRR